MNYFGVFLTMIRTMRIQIKIQHFFLVALFAFTACAQSIYQSTKVEYASIKIANQHQQKSDSVSYNFLSTYKDSVDKTMNVVIGYNAAELRKDQPEGTLGNFMADGMRTMAEKRFQTKVDFALSNNGGIRINALMKGDVTIGKMYELMPFDNMLVLLKMKGTVVRKFVNQILVKGGWPLSGMQIKSKGLVAQTILVQGVALEDEKEYTVATSDYIANGGDDCDFLKSIVPQNNSILLRDILIDYVKMLTAENKKIEQVLGARIVIEK
jgi:2',3'-cyclic-nucleotide 2'-phosphodiesterase (5'-nucleotidase family)